MVETKKRGRGRPKKIAPIVKIKEDVVELPITYLGVIMLNPSDVRMANHGVGNFEYDTKTQEYTLFTNVFPSSWEEFITQFKVGIYTLKDDITGLETKISKTEDSDKWIQYIESAVFPTFRGVYSISQVQKIYEAA